MSDWKSWEVPKGEMDHRFGKAVYQRRPVFTLALNASGYPSRTWVTTDVADVWLFRRDGIEVLVDGDTAIARTRMRYTTDGFTDIEILASCPMPETLDEFVGWCRLVSSCIT